MDHRSKILLGVNIDHIANVRQARGTRYPDPVYAAALAEQAGADAITVHLREDRRHIQVRDIELLAQTLQTRMNLEMAVTEEMLAIAEQQQPADCCLVPERREELTTEGGLDVVSQEGAITEACVRLKEAGVRVSLFIDADRKQIEAALRTGAPTIELHTGHYANASNPAAVSQALRRLEEIAIWAADAGLQVNAGHGLHYHNVEPICKIPVLQELNIGHAIVAQALFTGLAAAVQEMKRLIRG